jgi:L-threonylcarbamoyladenylate synthase
MPIVHPTNDAICEAARRLRAGGIVAFPTETVYGLGADTYNEEAIARVYRTKGRPFDNPLIAHVLDASQARSLTTPGGWDDRCDALADRFWPGPLTIIVPKSANVPALATAGYATIAVRAPSHVVARALLREFGSPISAPSANRSGRVSPTCAEHVAQDFADMADLLILDGGPCDVGIESTVLDLSIDRPHILRPGSVTAAMVSDALGEEVAAAEPVSQLASPGTALRHYAPRTPAELVDRSEIVARLAETTPRAAVIAHHPIDVPPPHELVPLSAEDVCYAAQLYAALRRADGLDCERILIERPGEPGDLWDAIRDRLGRAQTRGGRTQ